MSNKTILTATIPALLFAFNAHAQADWDHPADIPVIEPVTVGLAGEQPADICLLYTSDAADDYFWV